MKYIFQILSAAIIFQTASAQDAKYISIPAVVSFISNEHIYIKSAEASSLSKLDTLYSKIGNYFSAMLVVQFSSSTSAACTNISGQQIQTGSKLDLYLKKNVEVAPAPVIAETDSNNISITPSIQRASPEITINNTKFDGKFSVSSYTNLTNQGKDYDYQRWRYSLSLDVQNLFNIPLEFETYTNFSYRADQWNDSDKDLFDRLKIYSLNFGYTLGGSKISLGRKINPMLSNVGAIDGLQFETDLGNFSTGAAVGFRPDYTNYGINSDLFQTGVFVGRNDTLGTGYMRNTLSVFQQMNKSKTDRRFLYIQHSNNIINRDLNLFVSSELDLYKRERGVEKNALTLTSLYLSVRYSFARWLSFTTSYDARKNVIYYETYKTYADSVLENETRQGMRASINLRPLPLLFIRLNAGHRFQNSDNKSSTNYGVTAAYSRIPAINTSVTGTYNYLQTSYLNGSIYSLRLSRDLLDGLINASVGYRRVEYKFTFGGYSLSQNILSSDINLRLFARDYLSISYEGIFEKVNNFSRIYLNFTKRF